MYTGCWARSSERTITEMGHFFWKQLAWMARAATCTTTGFEIGVRWALIWHLLAFIFGIFRGNEASRADGGQRIGIKTQNGLGIGYEWPEKEGLRGFWIWG